MKSATEPQDTDLIRDAARLNTTTILATLGTSVTGLTGAEAAARLLRHGPNAVAQENH